MTEWRCFFCDEVFTDRAAASEHFGVSLDSEPLCKISAEEGGIAGKLREFEEQLIPYRLEDSVTERRMLAMQAEHATALRREEEKGYSRGLADGIGLAQR